MFLLLRHPRRSTLFPYTTLFRSDVDDRDARFLALRQEGELAVGRDRDPLRPAPGEVEPAELLFARPVDEPKLLLLEVGQDRKSTRLNSSHLGISYAVFCLKKKK